MNSNQLKYLALISMIIDHYAVVFYSSLSSNMSHQTYEILRGIGRLSFPIYAFLLVEGFEHTRNRIKYLSQLVIFALISEIPFDLALEHTYSTWENHPLQSMDWTKQNIFFTLALSLVAMMLLSYYEVSSSATIATILIFTYAGDLMRVDYGSLGVITILLFYYVKKRNLDLYKPWCYLIALLPLILGYFFTSKIQTCCLLAVIPITLYNGEKGYSNRYLKYLFYIAYPLHLLILLMIVPS